MAEYGFGTGFLTGLRTDVSGIQTPRVFGTLQDVAIEFTGDIKELFGQYQYAVDTARGKTKITGKAKLATIQGRFYNDIFFGQTLVTGQTKFVTPPGESVTLGSTVVATTNATSAAGSGTLFFASVPAGVLTGMFVDDTTTAGVATASSEVTSKTTTTVVFSNPGTVGATASDVVDFVPLSYTVALSGSTPLTDQGVFYASGTGLQLDAATFAPSVAGTYNFNAATGVYTFAPADAGGTFFVSYNYHVSTGYTITGQQLAMGNTPRFQATFEQVFEGFNVVLVLYACVSSRLTFPTRIDDYVIQDLDFSAFANASNQVFSWSVGQ